MDVDSSDEDVDDGSAADTASGAKAAKTPPGLAGVDTEATPVDVEALSYNTDGVVIFNGGHYSAGPEFIGRSNIKVLQESDEDGDEDEEGSTTSPRTLSVLEHTLVDPGSNTRMRCKITIGVGHMDNGEVDVQILRILLFKEAWVGPPDVVLPLNANDLAKANKPCVDMPRATLASMCGEFDVFTVSATAVEDVNPDTEVVLTFRMDNYVQDEDENFDRMFNSKAGNTAAGKAPRGFGLTMVWMAKAGLVGQLDRDYDGDGVLREVRYASGVKGKYSGGAM
eukprot:gene13502-19361_t